MTHKMLNMKFWRFCRVGWNLFRRRCSWAVGCSRLQLDSRSHCCICIDRCRFGYVRNCPDFEIVVSRSKSCCRTGSRMNPPFDNVPSRLLTVPEHRLSIRPPYFPTFFQDYSCSPWDKQLILTFESQYMTHPKVVSVVADRVIVIG